MSANLDTDIDDDLESGSANYDPLETVTASVERKDVLQQWKDITAGRKMILAIIGRSGTGKTTLINNMLGVKCTCEHVGAGGATTATHSHGNDIEGAQIEMFDTPGLGMPDRDEKLVFVDLQKITEKKADALLYCLSILPSSKLDDVELKTIKLLTRTFGKSIWKKIIIVFTFANVMLEMNDNDMNRLNDVTRRYAKEFQDKLQRIGINSQVSILHDSQDYDESDSDDRHRDELEPRAHKANTIKIAAIPAGRNQQLPDGTRWDVNIYEEVLKKCEHDDTPRLLNQICTCTVQ